jgi:hypothetical protein
MASLSDIHSYLDSHLNESLAELTTYCAQPSVTATGEGIRECAELTGAMLRKRGFEVELIETGGSPVVYGYRPGRSDRTLLFYNHYDVQPPDPLDLWDSPPFQPEIRDGKMFARGVSDDKGHVVSRLFALDALLAEDVEKSRDARQHSFSRSARLDVDVAIIRVSTKREASMLQFFVQIIEKNIRKQWREWASLRSPLHAGLDQPGL